MLETEPREWEAEIVVRFFAPNKESAKRFQVRLAETILNEPEILEVRGEVPTQATE